jgi:hypothetical protein
MKPQRGVLRFLVRYPLATLVAASMLLLTLLGFGQQVYGIWEGGVEPWQLYAGGAALLVTWVSMLMFKYDQERDQVAAAPAAPATAPAAAEIHNVTSHNQSGGITAHTVNQAPKPKIKQGQASQKRNPDGTYTVSCMFEVVSPYPPLSLKIIAAAPGIQSLEVSPHNFVGMYQTGHTGKRDGFCFTSLMHPSGKYTLSVVTAGKANVTLDYEFK